MAHPALRSFPLSSIFFLHQFPEIDRDISDHFKHKSTVAMSWRQLFVLLTIKLLLHSIFVVFLVRTVSAACKPTYKKNGRYTDEVWSIRTTHLIFLLWTKRSRWFGYY
jgi:hypothetical protein